ncbi:MAG: beta-lactamase family protein [Propionibacteriales bacterium]|nr:beta-lactamase family protein [Propionibacteriales bacterium]
MPHTTRHALVTRQPNLPRARPTDVGVDPSGVDAFLTATAELELHSLMLLRHGRVAAEGWYAPYEPDRVHLLYSLSKSFNSTAVGFAVAEGLVSLDDRVLDHFGELAEVCHPELRDLRLRHVLSMASGHGEDLLNRPDLLAASADESGRYDLVRLLLTSAPQAAPGTLFAYNQPASFTAGAIVQKVTGQSLTDYLRPRLFDPLGIEPGHWQTDRSGRELGFSGLHLTTEALAAFGQFLLQRGRWGTQQLLPQAWFDEACSPQIDTAGQENPDWSQGYGFQFWIGTHGFRGDGAFGQFCVMLPDHDAVLGTTSATLDMQAILAAAWEHLLPAFDRSGPAGGSDADALQDRLGSLAVDRPAMTPITAERELSVRSTIEWVSGAVIGPEELTLVINGSPHVLPCAADQWLPGDWPEGRPVATIGGTHDERVWACVALIDTPHRILLVEDAEGLVSIDWNIPPLGSLNPNGTGGRV